MSKRSITCQKPQDPSFIAKLKAQIGYKEGPTVETKKQKLDEDSDFSGGEERLEREDEKPQIVVLQSGDLNAEEVAQEEARITQETAETPADLNQPIIFQRRKPKTTTPEATTKRPQKKKTKQTSVKLSFASEDEQED